MTGKKYLKMLLIIFGIVFLAPVLVSSYVKPAVITVTGLGEESVAPAEVSLIATRLGAAIDPVSAISANETAVDRMVAVAKNFGGAETSVSKGFYQVTPQTNQYVAVNGISVKSKNVLGVNDLIRELFKTGATTVSNVNFSASEKEDVEQRARKVAVDNGRIKAQKMAGSVGKRLGRLISVADDITAQTGGTVSDVTKQTTGSSQSPANILVSKRVQMVYEIW